MEHVSNDHEDRPNQHENSQKLCDETGHPVLIKAIVDQTLASEEINKSKRAGLWEPQWVIRVGKLIIWERSFEIKITTVHQAYLFHQNRLASPYDGR